MSHATTSSQAPLSQADIKADDDSYVAATWLETLLVLGLPVAFTVTAVVALHYVAKTLGVL